jgi:hypothetical protein
VDEYISFPPSAIEKIRPEPLGIVAGLLSELPTYRAPSTRQCRVFDVGDDLIRAEFHADTDRHMSDLPSALHQEADRPWTTAHPFITFSNSGFGVESRFRE